LPFQDDGRSTAKEKYNYPCDLCERLVGASCPGVARRAKSKARRAKPEAGGEINTSHNALSRKAQLGPSRFAGRFKDLINIYPLRGNHA
jgi:hypothetical protein